MKILISGKKGNAREVAGDYPYAVATLFVILAVIFLFVAITKNYQENILHIAPHLENSIIAERFYYSPDCFVYYDSNIMRAYPFTIDPNKFTKRRLMKCADSKKGFRISIQYGKISDIISSNNWKGIASDTIEKKILVRESNGKLVPGRMMVEVGNNDI